MTVLFQAGEEKFQPQELLEMMTRYQLMPQFLRGLIIDKAIADIPYTEEEMNSAVGQIEAQYQLHTPEIKAAWLQAQGITAQQLQELSVRPLRLEKYKQANWGNKVENYFLTRKPYLDQVVYSLIRTKDLGLANEIYFRIQEGEQTFAELAEKYSEGPEAKTGGLLGPVSIKQPHPLIGQLLAVSQPGQLWPPRALAEWFVIIRLEKNIAAQLDDAMRHRLVDEMFENWLAEKIKEMGPLQVVENEN
ncbi:peptidylprolyl isomerase [Floridanema evergladense]|uniref:peptidylprolyl isomerase n=1 Tax=Floridaenema evergladense BLCC-F167 TaxID=3153639 RepID=A0ABV4WI29_9CYAN